MKLNINIKTQVNSSILRTYYITFFGKNPILFRNTLPIE